MATKSNKNIISARPGGSIVVECLMSPSDNRKYFCKDTCNGNILVRTHNTKIKKDKYSIEYVGGEGVGLVYVSIAKLTESDSGRYRCGVGTSASTASYVEFQVTVEGEMLFKVFGKRIVPE